jgi:RimJ/RimL family protein N-acetyltransferase
MAYDGSHLRLPGLLAVTHPENEGSRNVLHKLGFTHQGQSGEFYDTTVDLFSIERPTRYSEGAETH